MIELVKVFALIASQIESILYAKAKKYGYTNALLFIEKNRSHNLPSFTSTANLNNTTWKDIEDQMNKLDLSSEQAYLKQLRESYRHNGMPEEFLSC